MSAINKVLKLVSKDFLWTFVDGIADVTDKEVVEQEKRMIDVSVRIIGK